MSKAQGPTRSEKAPVLPETPLDGLPLTENELRRLFPEPWRHREEDSGRTLSFFYGNALHVVTGEKERRTGAPHAYALRSGASLLPDDGTLSAAGYASGVFLSRLSLGNPHFNQFLLACADPRAASRASGQRMLLLTDEGWRLLAVPSAFEMGLSACRWIYKIGPERQLLIRCWASGHDPAVSMEIRVVGDARAECLILQHIDPGMGGCGEGDCLIIDREKRCVECRPTHATAMSRFCPDAAFISLTPDRDKLAELGAAEPTESTPSPRVPCVAWRTRPLFSFRLSIVGSLESAEKARALARQYERPQPFEEATAETERSWATFLRNPEIAGRDAVADRLRDMLPWMARRVVIGLAAPRDPGSGDGAAWRVRDVCDGPVAAMVSLRHPQVAARIIRHVFTHQYETGDWPEWFMLRPYSAVHGGIAAWDAVLWPLNALADYIEATGDLEFLNAELPYSRPGEGDVTERRETLLGHAARLIARLESIFPPGPRPAATEDADAGSTTPTRREPSAGADMASWVVALAHHACARFGYIAGRTGRTAMAESLARVAARAKADFHRLFQCSRVPGSASPGSAPTPRVGMPGAIGDSSGDTLGVAWGIVSGLLSPAQAAAHADAAARCLKPDANDGKRPPPCDWPRFAEAMAVMGRAEELVRRLDAGNPASQGECLESPGPRQRNGPPSDAHGEAGLFVALVLARLLGLRERFGDLVIDPVLPPTLNRLAFHTEWEGLAVRFLYHVMRAPCSPHRIVINDQSLPELRYEENPYRRGGAAIRKKDFLLRLTRRQNTVEVYL